MKLSCPKYDKKSVVYKIWYLFKFGEQLYFVWETSIFCILNETGLALLQAIAIKGTVNIDSNLW